MAEFEGWPVNFWHILSEWVDGFLIGSYLLFFLLQEFTKLWIRLEIKRQKDMVTYDKILNILNYDIEL